MCKTGGRRGVRQAREIDQVDETEIKGPSSKNSNKADRISSHKIKNAFKNEMVYEIF